jgi:polysaccharide biosynthesis protein VpsQ
MQRFWKLGFAAQLSLVVLISIGAYAGVIPTVFTVVPHLDKLGHFILIGALAFFLDGALDHRELYRGLRFPRLAPVLVLAVAGIEEYLQRLSPRRTSEWGDFFADAVGVFFFAWLAGRVGRRFEERDREAAPTVEP